MFCSNFALRSLNISNFRTRKVLKMDYLFNNDMMLTSLDISNFNTMNVDLKRNFFNSLPNKGKIYLNSDKISNAILKLLPRGWEMIERQ